MQQMIKPAGKSCSFGHLCVRHSLGIVSLPPFLTKRKKKTALHGEIFLCKINVMYYLSPSKFSRAAVLYVWEHI